MLDKGKSGKSVTMAQKFKKRITKNGLICNKCKKDKSLDEYGVNKSWCAECFRNYNNSRAKKGRYKLW
jgi:uncharacterized CHY-type Zn-finger protein